MVKKTSELNNIDNQDPIAIAAGAGQDRYTNRRSNDYMPSEYERRELATNTGEHPPETEHIKAQIEETRHQMGGTIDAIQEKLSFSNISEQVSERVSSALETAKETVYDATVGKAVSFMKNMGDGISDNTIVKTARDNPLPLALIGIGAGLLAYNAMKPRQHTSFDGRREWSPEETYPQPVGENKSILTSAQEKLSNVTDTVSNTAGVAYDNITNKVTTAYSSAEDMAHKAYDKAGELGHYTQEQYTRYMAENPLAVGAIALAVGAAIGLAIPSTRYEGELMGDTRDELLRKAQETASEYIDKAKQVATETGRKIDDQVKTLAG
jgi:ElaB/YqjD/DUF883 family membrane-anchored ribosome-binding protein